MREYVLGIDLGTKLGVCKYYTDGHIEARTVKLPADIAGRVMGIERILKDIGPECTMVGIEEPFSQQFSSVKALFPMLGAAVSACERFLLPWQTINLMTVKKHATGRGNAKKEDMIAAAKERWGIDMDDNMADAAWVAAYIMDEA